MDGLFTLRKFFEISGVTTGGMGGSGPPTSVQAPPEICTNPLRSVLYIGGGGGAMHVYCKFLLVTSKEKLFGPLTFFGLATPLIEITKPRGAWVPRHRNDHR